MARSVKMVKVDSVNKSKMSFDRKNQLVFFYQNKTMG